ncbi:MAG: tRNA (adenosine(37)-N6)-dimethylallyltransferase MiaA [Oscillospiraceae bacterium]|nr:tRNA (adenosine(37)-N6)-dimethylallyltransferase MiaA [Oscillospiraceae bacterium]
MSDIPNMIVITGPTATGKTALGVAVAKAVDGEVIGADSMQIYRYMDIGTAKPTPAEMDGVPHHMVDIIDPAENYSVSRYVEQATAVADDILARGRVPVVVGGTGLYIDSLVAGREFAENQSDPKLRSMLEQQYDEHGGEAMRAMLHSFDPDRAEKLHPADKRRIVRAIEVYLLSGDTITAHDERTKAVPKRYNAVTYALDFTDRADLYRRIDLRVDRMAVLGLFDEVRALLDRGVPDDCTAMQAIGYKEAVLALRGAMTREEALERIKQSSRQYAKRQLTWLRRDKDIRWVRWDKQPDIPSAAYRIANDWRASR